MKATTTMSLIVAALMISGYQAHAAQGIGRATMKVVTAIAVTNVSDLIFTEAAAGAAGETVMPDNVETAQNASFTVTGEPNRAVNVTLPADGSVKMMLGAGGSADTEIPVNQFTSSTLTQIDASGTSSLYVGATRADLTATQTSGDYEGNFIVDVVYQ